MKFKIFDKKRYKDSFKLLNFSLAGKIGVGSISGIALAIMIGGKGSIFWIWVSSIILGVLTYGETKLGLLFGPPEEYIRDELNNKRLSKIYSLIIIILYLVAFILIQSNTIFISIESTFNVDKNILLIFISILIFVSINNDVDRISNIVSYLVPIMGIIYILIGLIVIINNINLIGSVFAEILKDSFSIRSLSSLPLIIGFERSIFCNEAGMGTTSMVVSLSKSKDYKQETSIQVLGTYFISLIICTISAFIILTTNYKSINITNINGIEIISYAFNYHFNEIGPIILSIITFLFAYSTIITSYYYGKINLKKDALSKIIVIIMVLTSTFISSNNIWLIVDILSSVATLINVYAIFRLRKHLRSRT